ncbi:MAG TPA: hypothetical protein VMF89_36000, partial [Polyangiales bacterium]|nr:hypothetical protein [Polyangiales bacterium]
GDVRLLFGDLASVMVDFLIVGFVLFAVARASNSLKKLHPHEPAHRECPQCLEKVAYRAKRCRYCTEELPPLGEPAASPPAPGPAPSAPAHEPATNAKRQSPPLQTHQSPPALKR